MALVWNLKISLEERMKDVRIWEYKKFKRSNIHQHFQTALSRNYRTHLQWAVFLCLVGHCLGHLSPCLRHTVVQMSLWALKRHCWNHLKIVIPCVVLFRFGYSLRGTNGCENYLCVCHMIWLNHRHCRYLNTLQFSRAKLPNLWKTSFEIWLV